MKFWKIDIKCKVIRLIIKNCKISVYQCVKIAELYDSYDY